MIGTCPLFRIEEEYGPEITADLRKAISLYSTGATPLSTIAANLPKIERAYDTSVVHAIHCQLAQCSTDGTPLNEASFSLPMVVTDGVCLLGQPLGSLTYGCGFYAKKIEENEKDATKLLSVVSDKHTVLRLFAQCTLYKLPHLLGSEVMYLFQETAFERWNEW